MAKSKSGKAAAKKPKAAKEKGIKGAHTRKSTKAKKSKN